MARNAHQPKSESSCLPRQSEGVKMEEIGSETGYCLKAIKCPRGLIGQIATILGTRLNCTK